MISPELSGLLTTYTQCGDGRQNLLKNITDTNQEGVIQDPAFIARITILMNILPRSNPNRAEFARDFTSDNLSAKQLSEAITYLTKALSPARTEHGPLKRKWKKLQAISSRRLFRG